MQQKHGFPGKVKGWPAEPADPPNSYTKCVRICNLPLICPFTQLAEFNRSVHSAGPGNGQSGMGEARGQEVCSSKIMFPTECGEHLFEKDCKIKKKDYV